MVRMKVLKYLDGRLHFGIKNHDLSRFERAPLYIYEWSGIAERFNHLEQAFRRATQSSKAAPVRIHYAMKANSHPEILKSLAQLDCGVDVVSGNEMSMALECGFAPHRVIFSGVGKSHHEIRQAIDKGIRQINVESLPELRRILDMCQAEKKTANLALRLNPNVDPKTHPYISTGLEFNKFGIDGETAQEALRLIQEHSAHLHLRGLTMHIGSQILETSVFREAAEWMATFVRGCREAGHTIESLDLGGGVGIHYDRNAEDEELSLMDTYAQVARQVFPEEELLIEPGRWLVGHSGILLAKVEYVKRTPKRNFVILDTGMHHLLRPALYGANHRIFPVRQGESKETFDVVGPICESSDIFARDLPLPALQEGDLIAIADAGAYGYEMASEYNLQQRPERVFLP